MRTFEFQPGEYGHVSEISHADRIRAALRMRSWQLETYAEAARQLNAADILTATGKQWTADNLRSYTQRHGIPDRNVPPTLHPCGMAALSVPWMMRHPTRRLSGASSTATSRSTPHCGDGSAGNPPCVPWYAECPRTT